MLIAGIIGSEGKQQTAGLISSILTSRGKRVSVVDSKNLLELDKKRIKAYIGELGKNNTDILLLKINLADIDSFLVNDLHFDIMIYTDRAEKTPEPDHMRYSAAMGRFFSLMSDKGVAIVNADDSGLLSLLQGLKQHVVTYGFNTKASITTSSVGDSVLENNFICCLQRTISARNGAVIEPQEYKLELEASGFDTHSVLAAASFAIVNGIDLNGFDDPQRFRM
jgi:UDP-N-acetylmuramate-alanine ligase